MSGASQQAYRNANMDACNDIGPHILITARPMFQESAQGNPPPLPHYKHAVHALETCADTAGNHTVVQFKVAQAKITIEEFRFCWGQCFARPPALSCQIPDILNLKYDSVIALHRLVYNYTLLQCNQPQRSCQTLVSMFARLSCCWLVCPQYMFVVVCLPASFARRLRLVLPCSVILRPCVRMRALV